MMQRLPMQPLSVGPAFGRLLAHTDEIPRSSKCRLLRVDRKWLNDATGEQAFETVPRQAVVSRYLGTRRCDMATTATQVVLDTPAADFPFPYLHDETQTVARAYGAVCTPDFFGYNADRRLKYRGRLDEGRTTPPRAEAPRELVEAMRAIAATGVAPADQKASIGCSIKWKDA